MLPTWEVLANISKNTGVQIFDLLLIPQLEISNKNIEYVRSLSQIKSNISDLADIIDPGDKNLKNILEISIFEYPPPSITEITRRVGFYPLEKLKRNHPSLYKRIVEKHKNYIETNRKVLSEIEIEDVLLSACIENPPPSLKNIFRGINCLNIAYRYFDKHPTLCLIIAIRHKNVREQIPELVRIEKRFAKAFNKQLTPVTSDFPMIKFPRRILNRYFPELCEILINQKNDKLKTPSQEVREFSKHIENLYYSNRNRDRTDN
jgi:hypothetical protein